MRQRGSADSSQILRAAARVPPNDEMQHCGAMLHRNVSAVSASGDGEPAITFKSLRLGSGISWQAARGTSITMSAPAWPPVCDGLNRHWQGDRFSPRGV